MPRGLCYARAMAGSSAAACKRLCSHLGSVLRWRVCTPPHGRQLHIAAEVPMSSLAVEAVALHRRPFAMPEQLVRVSYMSVLKYEGEEADRIVQEIARGAFLNNREEGITGFMSYDATFSQVWQVLEGDHSRVMPLWDRILKDQRHVVGTDTVCVETTDRRIFPQNWAMRLRLRGITEI
mmetsp:Transcript_61322/g.142680  ORF Transcript_61322/g.142680 Transcript_61322/m.142680 type:complete len:179 (+) Transcript_61322:15-551(+)